MRFSSAMCLAVGAVLCGACGSDSATGLTPGQGQLVVQLKDAPLPVDEVSSVDVFVVRVDARTDDASDAQANANVDGTSSVAGGWKTVAEPNASIDLLTLSGGNTATIGQAALAAGTYRSLRLILDVSQSSITLKDGTTLTGTSTPPIVFPSAAQTGIKILLDTPITIDDGGTTTVLVDFDVAQSFIVRGNTIMQNGLLFTPVIRGTVQPQ